MYSVRPSWAGLFLNPRDSGLRPGEETTMRDIMVHVRLNPKERENLEKLANIEGTSMAETARLLIRDAAMKLNSREKEATAR
jgi:hypothetical protein